MTKRLADVLNRHRRVALDTSVFIYHVENYPRYSHLADLVFAWLEQPGHTAVTSTITMTEILVQPYRTLEPRRVEAMHTLLIALENLDWIAPSLEISDLAARMRAQYRLQTADAIQAATAIDTGATLLITNDFAFRRVSDFDSLILDDLL